MTHPYSRILSSPTSPAAPVPARFLLTLLLGLSLGLSGRKHAHFGDVAFTHPDWIFFGSAKAIDATHLQLTNKYAKPGERRDLQ